MRRSKARSHEAIEFAKDQRTRANEFSATVWQWLRNRRCRGQKFRREFPIPPYTVDFCCLELQLIVEIDGKHHGTAEGLEHDVRRDRFLEALGYQVLRVPGYEVVREDGEAFRRIDEAVRIRIDERLSSASPSPPAPLPAAGRGGQETLMDAQFVLNLDEAVNRP